MKRVFLATTLAATGAVAACGTADQEVTRNKTAPLSFAPMDRFEPSYFSSRSAVDLLTLS